jgi:hypothetical protein
MRLRPFVLVLALCAAVAPSPASAERDRSPRSPSQARLRSSASGAARDLLAGVPLTFEENRGQAVAGAAYLARGDGWVAAIRSDGARFDLGGPAPVSMRLRGARAGTRPAGVDPRVTRSNYFLGNDPSKWVTDAPHFGAVRVDGALPGVDVVWRAEEGRRLRYDFEVAAGVDPGQVALDFEGATSVLVDGDGALVVASKGGTIRHSRPVAWQEGPRGRDPVDCRFSAAGTTARLVCGARDPGRALVVDPTLEVAINLGSSYTIAYGCAFAPDGTVLLAGRTTVAALGTFGTYQPNHAGSDDVFVAKYQRSTATLAWFTYLGAADADIAWCLAAGLDGSVYVAGQTTSASFPVKTPVMTYKGSLDVFVSKIGPQGNSLAYSTFLGGTSLDLAYGIAVGADGSAWLGGWTNSSDYPLKDALDGASTLSEGFLTKLAPAGDAITVSTLYGGSGSEFFRAVAIAPDGTVWAGGFSDSTDLVTASPVQGTFGGGSYDALMVALSSDGQTLEFASYFGGSGPDDCRGVAVDPFGNAFFGGLAGSTDFPLLNAIDSTTVLGDSFLCRVDGDTKGLAFSTYIGGSGYDDALAVAADPYGNVFVTGTTTSNNFPLVDAVDSTYGGNTEGFLAKFAGDGSSLLFGTYLGAVPYAPYCVAADGSMVLVAGRADSGGTASTLAYEIRFLPDALFGLQIAAKGGARVELSWSDPNPGAFDFEIQRKTGADAFATIATEVAGTTFHADTTTTEDVIYQYRMRGTSDEGDTGWSAPIQVRTPPYLPTAFQAGAISNDQVSVTWIDVSGVEVGYDVLRRPAGSGVYSVVASLPPDSESYTDSLVAAETAYQYFVRALGPTGSNADTTPATVSTPPTNPENLSSVCLDDQTARLEWLDLSDAETGYEIQRRDDDAAGAFVTVATTGPSAFDHLDEGLDADHAYSWRIRAVNGDGGSDWTAVVSRTTPPPPPGGVTAEALHAESLRLEWTASSPAATGYRVETAGPGEESFLAAGTVTAPAVTLDLSGLRSRATYSVRVKALNDFGASRPADPLDFAMPAQLLVTSAKRSPAKGSRPARLAVAGRFDLAEDASDLSGPATLKVGAASFSIPGFVAKGAVLRHAADGLRLDLKPARSGGSSVALALVLDGPVAEALDPEGPFVLTFSTGTFTCMGGADLAGGAFDAKRGIGSRASPAVALNAFKASIAKEGDHSVALQASYRTSSIPFGVVPDVRLSLGGVEIVSLQGAKFEAGSGVWVLKVAGPPQWTAIIDPVKGTLSLKGRHVDLGAYPEGPVPVDIGLDIGTLRFRDVNVLVSNGKTLGW